MVETGQMKRSPGTHSARRRRLSPAASVAAVDYAPPGSYDLDIEVLEVADLRRRGTAEHFAQVQRIEFALLLAVTAGHCRHMIDFSHYDAGPGDWLHVRPGQVQRFDFRRDWQGVLVVWRDVALGPADHGGSTTPPPPRVRPDLATHRASLALLRQMRHDAAPAARRDRRAALLRLQLQTLLWRLADATPATAATQALPVEALLTQRFRAALEAGFATEHRSGVYARRLGCSVRHLDRACRRTTGLTAKGMLTQRVLLEAQRLLAHSEAAAATIGAQLGFAEATNFAKFFRREAGCTPGEFRRRQRTR